MNSMLEINPLFRNIYCWLAGNEGNVAVCGRDGLLPGYDLGTNGLAWLGFLVAGFTIIFIIVNAVMLGTAIFTWGERRLVARFQTRVGPNRWGPFGLLQPIADLVKMLGKENITPTIADKVVFVIAPVALLAPALLIMAVMPFARNTFVADLNIAVLFIVAIGGIGTVAIFMAGWSSGNRYALFGAMRAVAVLLSYEIPVVLALAGVVLVAGSMSILTIADSQKYILYVLVQPLGAFVFIVGASAEMNRSPFDIVEAESELVAGYHTEYSGIKFGVFQAAEFAAVLINSAIFVNLFLGGWSGLFLSSQLGALWFIIKILFVVFLFEWIRFTIPRLRIDQIMAFAWKYLLPLSFINLVVTAVEIYVFQFHVTPGSITTGELWLMAGINIIIAGVCIPIFGNLVGEKIIPPRREPLHSYLVQSSS